MKANITQLTPAQLASQKIEQSFDKLDLRASGIINDLTRTLTTLEEEDGEQVQALFDLWGNRALGYLMSAKNMASELETLGATIIHLRPDFAIPEFDGEDEDGQPIYTGVLTYNPPATSE